MANRSGVKKGLDKLNKVEKELAEGKRLYTLKEAGIYLGRSVHSVRELVWAKLLPVVQHGRKMWIDLMDLEDYIDKHKAHV